LHKDQKRIQDALLPYVMDRVLAVSPEAERDCTVLNRALIQGPDPLYLTEVCPTEFEELCLALGLSAEDGRKAIESAHWTGPGCLLLGTGLPVDCTDFSDIPKEWRQEALWLVLASMSDCTEEGYQAKITLVQRFQRQARAISNLSRFAYGRRSLGDVMFKAIGALRVFNKATVFTFDERGFPHTDRDEGFYIGYKAGHKVVGVKAGNNIFYGTTPDTTLAEQGVVVDVNISPSYGFVRPKAV
jgi:hypothetical protein